MNPQIQTKHIYSNQKISFDKNKVLQYVITVLFLYKKKK